MKRFYYYCLGLVVCYSFRLVALDSSHNVTGTSYGEEGIARYALHRHGPDGAILLDPYFIPYLENIEGKDVLDAGCGAAPWAIYAALHGGKVFGIDIQQKMIEQGLKAVQKANLSHKVDLVVGDVALLPCPSDFFDLAISINVGCNLPSTPSDSIKPTGLGFHLKEMRRVLRQGGQAILTAPASFATVFANSSDHQTILNHIFTVLSSLSENPSSDEIISRLNELTEIYRATFVVRNGRLTLVTDEHQLQSGEDIWRKLPGLTVPNRYHSETEYLQEIEAAGFKVKQQIHPKFQSEEELFNYNRSMPENAQMGQEYVEHNPFIIFYLE